MKKLALFGIAILMAMTLVISCDDIFAKTFTVTFDTDGGTEISPVSVIENMTVVAPNTPVKIGYNFIEWQLDGKPYDFTSLVKKDITLTATWERDETVWLGAEDIDITWYNDEDIAFTLTKASQLAGLAQLVNAGNSFEKKTIVLANNIDLGKFEWTPIGTEPKQGTKHSFNGTFDGQGKTISNLYIKKGTNAWLSNSHVGLFGYTQNGEIKNLTIHNANVTGGTEVGAVAGTPYTSTYKDITLTGRVIINGNSYVGSMFGKNAYADLTNLTVNVEEGSYVKADSEGFRTYVGGVVGFMGEGSFEVTNATSNIDVIGSTCDIGGITGIAHYGNSFINCSSSGNIVLENANDEGDQYEIGGISGVWMNSNKGKVTFENCSFTGTLTTHLNGVNCSDKIEEANRLTGTKYNRDSSEGELIIK